MNYLLIFLAALGAFVAYFAIGGLAFTSPTVKNEFLNTRPSIAIRKKSCA